MPCLKTIILAQVMAEALKVLQRTSEVFPEVNLEYEDALIGGAAYDAHGVHFPDATRDVCSRSNAILFGSIGGPVVDQHLPKWKDADAYGPLSTLWGCTAGASEPLLAPGAPGASPRTPTGLQASWLRKYTLSAS